MHQHQYHGTIAFSAFAVFAVLLLFADTAVANDGYDLWLRYTKVVDKELHGHYQAAITSVHVPGESATLRIVREELKRGLDGLFGNDIPFIESIRTGKSLVVATSQNSTIVGKLKMAAQLKSLGDEGYVIRSAKIAGGSVLAIVANKDIGLLYGTFHFLRLLQTHQSLANINTASKPSLKYRLLDHWDNLDGSVERGYAGKSLWKWDELPGKVDQRYYDYARANASIAINGVVLNNVNANPSILKVEYLQKISALANVFRPYGIRVFLSANFSSPISARFKQEGNRRGGIGNLPTSDPLDPKVREWWKEKAKEIYKLIPDFGGFLVKANSEGMPGPQEYKRTHADGANMLGEALAPFGGIVMWRAFVYDPDVDTDRVKRAYREFVPLDGHFRSNVFVQAKNGPLDFQPREPVQPLFGAMPQTPLMLELQLTQEYLGHSTHLVYLAPMWKEYLQFDTFAKGRGSTLASVIDGSLQKYRMTGIAGVANIGDDRNWCGHFFAQSNWFAYGRLAWNPALSPEEIADDWIRMSLTNDSHTAQTINSLMMGSWEACINYMTPLGLHHIMQEGFHYGPGPQHDKGREDWRSTYYHRADGNGIGFDRSSTGSNAVGQYPSPLRETYDGINTCPEQYLLWFHHVEWDRKLKSGSTLWEELCSKYYVGTEYVANMARTWASLEQAVDPAIYVHVKSRLEKQNTDASIWRDTCLNYFQKFSRKPIFFPQGDTKGLKR